MDFKLQMGILLAILGVHLSIVFLYVALFLSSVLPWVILCLGWCKCWAFFSCDKYLYCFFLFWEGNWNNLQLNNCFWKICQTRPDWMATEEAAAVEAVLKW